MKKIAAVAAVLLLAAGLRGELVKNESDPSAGFQSFSMDSIVIFPFDARSLADGERDHLAVSRRFQDDLIGSFGALKAVNPTAGSEISVTEGMALSTVRGSGSVKDYNERSQTAERNLLLAPDNSPQAHLVGTIDSFLPGRTYAESFIRVTFKVIDAKSKLVLWITTMEGCYGYVVRSIADSVTSRKFVQPESKDPDWSWVDPHEAQAKLIAAGIDYGAVLPVAGLARKMGAAGMPAVSVDFSLPFLGPVLNRASLGLATPIDAKVYDFMAFRYIPLTLSFYWPLPMITRKDFRVYPRLDVGMNWSTISFPGLTYERSEVNSVTAYAGVGAGAEYLFGPFILHKDAFFLAVPAMGVRLGFMFDFINFRDVDLPHYSFRTRFRTDLGLNFRFR